MKSYENYVVELIRSLNHQIIFVVILLIAGVVFGFFDLLGLNEFIESVVEQLMNTFSQYRGFELFIRILLNNSRVAAMMILGGVFFSVLPSLGALVNGMVIGFIFQSPQIMAGRSAYLVFLQLLPHGVFEIPALILAFALGMKLGGWPLKGKKIEYLKINLKDSFLCYFRVVLPMLIIAAGIETIGVATMYFLFG